VSCDGPELLPALDRIEAEVGEVFKFVPIARGTETIDRTKQTVDIGRFDELGDRRVESQARCSAIFLAARCAIP
jgi:hypothetical protein